MLSERSRLLILLVLLAVAATAGWTTALAGEKTGSSTASSSFERVSKPPAAPASGEPDVGQTPRPSTTKGALSPAQWGNGGSSQGSSADRWLCWIFRMWTIRYLGAR